MEIKTAFRSSRRLNFVYEISVPTSAVLFLFFACSIFGLQEINVTILMNIWITIVLF